MASRALQNFPLCSLSLSPSLRKRPFVSLFLQAKPEQKLNNKDLRPDKELHSRNWLMMRDSALNVINIFIDSLRELCKRGLK
jgi:hypothetical protein